ncbi:VOC family protein [Pseudonocardia lutea]|uniref:VOC family protein n=1 Tax=Pseudonocardia lutea TaxID=2172015 RepID=A0ABW1I1Q4_9PSEU
MITGLHTIVYAEDAERARAFLRDILGLAFVDAHDGWLIFAAPPAEIAVHPTGPADSGRHELYLMCDDVERTVAELTAKGVEFTGPVEDQGWGLLTRLHIPGGGELGLYEPRHASPISGPAPRPRGPVRHDRETGELLPELRDDERVTDGS